MHLITPMRSWLTVSYDFIRASLPIRQRHADGVTRVEHVNASRRCDKSRSVSTRASDDEHPRQGREGESKRRDFLECNCTEGAEEKIESPGSMTSRWKEESIDFHRARKSSVHGSRTVLPRIVLRMQDWRFYSRMLLADRWRGIAFVKEL